MWILFLDGATLLDRQKNFNYPLVGITLYIKYISPYLLGCRLFNEKCSSIEHSVNILIRTY